MQSIKPSVTRHHPKLLSKICGGVFALVLTAQIPALSAYAAATQSTNRSQLFAQASQEFGIPQSVLMAVSYNESRWQSHGASASVDGGYGLMNLTTKVSVAEDGRGDVTPKKTTSVTPKTHYTLDEAAQLLHVSKDQLKSNDQLNIRGAAAVLASYAKTTNNGVLPGSINDWYGAVAAYSGSNNDSTAQTFATDVFSTIQTGAALKTTDNQTMSLGATPSAVPNHDKVSALKLQGAALAQTQQNGTDCPTTITCRFIPAGYSANSTDPADYGNYDNANRPKDMKIKYLIIHDTEGSYTSAISHFQDTKSYVSANYVIRSSDGQVTEMVRPKDVSWAAADWYVNMHGINIEHEGYADNGGTWYTEAMYRSSAQLVTYLANKYNIPLDRQHIIGHDEVSSLSATGLTNQHWDPGAYWDWDHYMDLVKGATTNPQTVNRDTAITKGSTVAINPTFATNHQTIQDCSTGTCQTLPEQGSNFVYLRTNPSATSPLLTDKYVHTDGSAGTTQDADWGDKVTAGEKFIAADQQGDWTAIWYGGQVGWFYNPANSNATVAATAAQTITPKKGLASIGVYGAAYPEASAYPTNVPMATINQLYTIPASQSYVSNGKMPTDYFYDATLDYSLPHDHEIIQGQDKYYQISFNHRIGFVKASDVNVH